MTPKYERTGMSGVSELVLTRKQNKWKFLPGSKEAVVHGCLCPEKDNPLRHKSIVAPEMFWVNQDCALHCQEGRKEED